MDFLDPKKRKAHNRRILIGYGLIGLLVSMISILLLMQAYGYTYNFRTGNISQNGLLFVDAHPQPASLYVNDELKGITDQRLVLEEGVYNMSLQREGYHNWEQTVVLKGGVIERFFYPFLFPAEIESADVERFSRRPDFVTQSPDRQWLVVQVPGSLNAFELLNLNDENPTPNRFSLPDDVLTASDSKHSLALTEWSTNNRHFVMSHTFGNKKEYVLVDTEQPGNSRNLNDEIDRSFSSLRLRDKKFDSYYLHNSSNKSLVRYDLSNNEATEVADNVLAYQSHGDDELLYVTDGGRDSSKSVSLRMVDNAQTYTIAELPRSSKYLLEVAQYEGDWYLVAGTSNDEKVYVYRNPVEVLRRQSDFKIIPEAVLRIENASSVAFSQNARIIAAQAGASVAIYDAERGSTFHFDTKLPIHKNAEFVWMDGHRLTAIVEGTQYVFDFDGSNMRSLGTGYSTSQPYFDRDYTAVFTIAPSLDLEGRAAVQRTELIVEDSNI